MQSQDILISYITVTFNAAATLERCLASIAAAKAHSKAKLEHIVIDGKSSDNTIQIIASHRQTIDKLISEPDHGIYDAMNKGLKLAGGRYICFINADDRLLPQSLPRLERLLQRNGRRPAIVATAAWSKSPGELPGLWVAQQPDHLAVFRCPNICHNGLYVQRLVYQKIGLFDASLKIAADTDWILRAWQQGYHFHITHWATMIYSLGGASSDLISHTQEMVRIARKIYPALTIATIHQLFRLYFTWPERRHLFNQASDSTIQQALFLAISSYPSLELTPTRRARFLVQRWLHRLRHRLGSLQKRRICLIA